MIYLSGPISNPDPVQIKNNLNLMHQKARDLRARGLEIFNPAESEEKEARSWEYYLIRDLIWIYNNRPALYFMKGWENSRGCRLEHEISAVLALPREYE